MKRFLFGWLLLASLTALAQDDFYKKEQPKPTSRRYVITLVDGTKLIGTLIRQDSTEAVISTTKLGQVTVKADQITSIVLTTGDAADANSFPNLFPQYLITSPTAFQAERGKLYYRNTYLSLSQFDYGITDNWSIGTSFFTYDPTLLASLKTKISVPVGRGVRVGVQGQIGTGRNLSDINGGLTYLQGVVSVGSSQRNVTLGVGALKVFDRFSSAQLLTIATVRKVSPSLTFIGEVNTILGTYTEVTAGILAGLRFDRKRHSFDLAIATAIPAGGGFPILPYLAYQLRIGK